jgi:transcriptional regulator with XRE-family HTH domain
MIGKKIYEARKLQGLSQEELAEKSKLNIRTLQRIENDSNVPRGKTIQLLNQVLNIPIEELSENVSNQKKSISSSIIHGIFLLLVNIIIMLIFGLQTLDQSANINNRFGAVILSFFLGYFIVTKTSHISGSKRIILYGSGMISYLLLVALKHHFPTELLLGFYPSILLYLSVLFYGDELFQRK